MRGHPSQTRFTNVGAPLPIGIIERELGQGGIATVYLAQDLTR